MPGNATVKNVKIANYVVYSQYSLAILSGLIFEIHGLFQHHVYSKMNALTFCLGYLYLSKTINDYYLFGKLLD